MGFSLDNQQTQSAQYTAPDPAFITIVMALGKGFPWDRFQRFFEARPLIDASALDQVFLMRVLALQEMLCLNDADMLRWLRNQMHLFAFISFEHNPDLPDESVLVSFRGKLNELKILQPFRNRCQRLILKYEDVLTQSELNQEAFPDLMIPEPDHKQQLDLPEIEERWVTCPLCESSALNNYIPEHLRPRDCEPWADCSECGHKFKIG